MFQTVTKQIDFSYNFQVIISKILFEMYYTFNLLVAFISSMILPELVRGGNIPHRRKQHRYGT